MYARLRISRLTFLMTCLVILGLLAGCQAVPQPPTPPPVEEEPQAAAPAEEAPAAGEAEMTITGVFHPNDESDGDIVDATGQQSVLYREMFPAFRERNPGVELVAEDLLGDTEGRTKQVVSASDLLNTCHLLDLLDEPKVTFTHPVLVGLDCKPNPLGMPVEVATDALAQARDRCTIIVLP